MADSRGLGAILATAALVLLVPACSPSNGELDDSRPTPARAGRFGSLRDFVLFDLPSVAGTRPLFVDRFEVTRADWIEFAATAAGRAVQADSAARLGDGALPVGRISLGQGRAFAVWRFARLPRLEEWLAVVRGDGRYRYPWGSKADATRANTAELGLGEPTLVGTFESGRRAVGQPYDLIGNVSEWTESVPVEWCLHDAGVGVSSESLSLQYTAALRDVQSMAALAVWQPIPGLVPSIAAVVARSNEVPREVVGADFQSSMLGPTERVLGGDRRLRTGIRLVTTPVELLRALIEADVAPSAADYDQLERFIARKGHRGVLRSAFAEVGAEPARGVGGRPLQLWLRERLGP